MPLLGLGIHDMGSSVHGVGFGVRGSGSIPVWGSRFGVNTRVGFEVRGQYPCGVRWCLSFGFGILALSEQTWARHTIHLDVERRLICTGTPDIKLIMACPDLLGES